MAIRKFKTVGKIIYAFTILFLIFVASLMIISSLDNPKLFKLYTVQSGSMEPAIKTGSIVLSRSRSNYKEGDIITFKNEEDKNNPSPAITTTHRIVGTQIVDGEIFYNTKGDANSGTDGTPVNQNLVLGKIIFSAPLIGYLIGFSKTPSGLITLIIIPSTIIVYSELQNIQKEAKRLIEERKKRKLSKLERLEVKIGENVSNIKEEITDVFSDKKYTRKIKT